MAAYKNAVRTHQTILDAANRVVLERGAAAMTLDAVAREAGISKGALLYHFPTKEALIIGLVGDMCASFNAAVDDTLGAAPTDAAPGTFLRAYAQATFALDQQSLEIGAALLAAASENPELLAPFRADIRTMQERAVNDGVEHGLATLLRLAVDGLWFAMLFDLAPPDQLLRAQLLDAIQALSRGETS